MAKIKLAPPWVTFASETAEMFRHDPEVHVVFDDEYHRLTLYVDSGTKADALARLLPDEKKFGNVTLTINVIPANNFIAVPIAAVDVFQAAFKGNDAFSFAKCIKGVFANDLTYVVFKNKVVQYFNDDLGDIYGQRSTLYENIARNLFGVVEGVFFCTDLPEGTGTPYGRQKSCCPLGEWP